MKTSWKQHSYLLSLKKKNANSKQTRKLLLAVSYRINDSTEPPTQIWVYSITEKSSSLYKAKEALEMSSAPSLEV